MTGNVKKNVTFEYQQIVSDKVSSNARSVSRNEEEHVLKPKRS